MVTLARLARAGVTLGSLSAVALAAHTAVNLRALRTPHADPTSKPRASRELVSILVPARNEEATIRATLASACEQRTEAGSTAFDIEIIVLDDGSTDATATSVTDLAARDARVRLIRGADTPPPPEWLGKPWACARLSHDARGTVLVFVDADVVLEPDAIAALVDELRGVHGAPALDMVAPYPHQEAEGWLERLVQPLVTWSWVATMPLAWAERSARPSLSAANGQVLAVDADAYRSVGGHEAVAGEVLEDIALMRAFKRAGLRAATVDGSQLARCRMYQGTDEVIAGYSKSLWDAFNGPAGSMAVNTLLIGTYVIPALAAVTAPRSSTRAIGATGYAAGVISRALVARRTDERVLPDVLAHPMSVVAFAALNAVSWYRHERGTNEWKGRSVVAAGGAG